jgi:hypothetical protein
MAATMPSRHSNVALHPLATRMITSLWLSPASETPLARGFLSRTRLKDVRDLIRRKVEDREISNEMLRRSGGWGPPLSAL